MQKARAGRKIVLVYIVAAALLAVLVVSCSRRPSVPAEFQGKYRWANGFGYGYVTLEKHGRFKYLQGGCVGVYFKFKGTYGLYGSRVIIAHMAKPVGLGPEDKVPICRDFHLVKWGGRHMLLDDKDMSLYCAFVAARRAPSHSRLVAFCTKVGDEKKPIGDSATIPEGWEDYYHFLVATKPDEKKALRGQVPIPPQWKEYFELLRWWGIR